MGGSGGGGRGWRGGSGWRGWRFEEEERKWAEEVYKAEKRVCTNFMYVFK